MNRKSVAGLIVVNMVLVLVLGVLCLTPQPAAAQLRGGDYVMISGRVQGRTTSAVYIVELNSALMMVVEYDLNKKRFTTLAGRNMANDIRGRR